MIALDQGYALIDRNQVDPEIARLHDRIARLESLLADQAAFGYSITDLLPIIEESRRTLRILLERRAEVARLERRERTARELSAH